MVERRVECKAINNTGNIIWQKGGEEALGYYRQALSIARETGGRLNGGRTLGTVDPIPTEQFKYSEALQYLETGLALFRDPHQRDEGALVLDPLGIVLLALEGYDDALRHRKDAAAIARRIDDVQGEAEMLAGLSHIDLFRGNRSGAVGLARRAIGLIHDPKMPGEEADARLVLEKGSCPKGGMGRIYEDLLHCNGITEDRSGFEIGSIPPFACWTMTLWLLNR